MPFPSTLLRLPATAVMLSLCACAGNNGTDADATAALRTPLPEQWQNPAPPPADGTDATATTTALATWWSRFDDTVLNELVATALKDSPDVRTALSRIAESRARRGIARAGLLPSLSAGVAARDNYRRDHNAHRTTSGDSYSAALDASWEIDLFGKNTASFAAATAELAQAQENFHAAQVTLVAEVATAYVALRAAETQLAVVERNLETRRESTRLTQWREQAGTGNSLDVQQAVSTLEQARASLPAIHGTIERERNRLATLTGKTPHALDTLLAPVHRVPAPPPALALGIPADTLRQRPDIRAAERAVEAAVQHTRAADSERYPTLNLSGSIGIEALKAGNLFSPDATVGSLLAGLTAPLFDGGRISQNIAIRDELQKQALLAYETAVLAALAEVENALSDLQRAAERLDVLKNATTAAASAAALALLQYQSGQVDFSTVLDTQRLLLSLEEQTVATTADQTTAHIRLYKALGGGWTNTAEN
ncbi:MAG: efflux transporter outer membrane subunit [Puniceicoccales bacterium]|nr:efflux transporter outer membrane subunit [Puniceicoccales bacterium]